MSHLIDLEIELFRRGIISSTLSLSNKQREALSYLIDPTTKTLYFGGGAGGGKSWLGCEWSFDLSVAFPGVRGFIAREELKRIRQSTLITWAKLCKHKKYSDYKINLQDNYIRFENGSQIDLLDIKYLPSDPLYERFGSTEYTFGWIEEGGETHFDAYDTLQTRIGRHLNLEYNICPTTLITLNPKKNWCYTYGYKKHKEGALPDCTKFIQSLYTENEFLSEQYIDNLKNIKDKAKKERLLYGNWEYDDDPSALIDSYDTILDIFRNQGKKTGKRYITCDAARFGSDKARICVWDGFVIIETFSFDISKTTDISSKIKELQRTHVVGNRYTIVDADGVGGGVVDEVGCIGFINNAKPIKRTQHDNFDNLQSQCGFLLSDSINASEFAISCKLKEYERDEIIEELEQLKRDDVDNDNKKKLLKKKIIKQNIGRSPDWRDTFLMRYYYEIRPKSAGIRSHGTA